MPVSSRQAERSRVGRSVRTALFGIVGLFDLAIVIALATTGRGWLAAGRVGPGASIVLGVFGGVAILLTLALLRSVMGRAAYQELDLTLAHQAVPLGGKQQVTVSIRAKRNLLAKEIRLRLVRRERAVSHAGNRDSTYIDAVAVETKMLAEGTWLSPMQPLAWQEAFRVPVEAAPSIATRYSSLTWLVELAIKVARWPDTNLACEFLVQPEARRAGKTEEAGEA